MARIGVDRGHGKNTFPPSKGLYKNGIAYHEFDANSRVAAKLIEKLKRAGHIIVEAQKANSNDVPLTTRTNKYIAEKVDMIVSCHANYSSNPDANGYASFYWYSDKEAKKLSDLYEEEIKAQGFRLWGGSRPSMPGIVWNNFHMCRIPAKKGIPSILLENGFMGNNEDFEWIFGSKKDKYAEKCATAAFNAIQRYLGESIEVSEDVQHVSKPVEEKPSKPQPKPKEDKVEQVSASEKGKRVESIYKGSEGLNFYSKPTWDKKFKVGTFNYGMGWNIVRKLKVDGAHMYEVKNSKNDIYYITASPTYVKVEGQSKPVSKPKPKKSITQMAQEIIAKKHGDGHENRRKSLGISKSEYEKVRAEVNRILSGKSKPAKPKKSISQMADMIINDPKAPNGHENRRKWLGISKAEYEKVRAEVNRRL